ncbi:MAG: alpha/beta hydrolase [Selenomonadaceae bacterium]|nr:alpha/beta hydrolase [Selenomonadaceae bacterium]
MFKPKKSVILAAILAGVVSMGNFSDVSAAPTVSATSTTMKNCSISDLTNDTRVFTVDKEIQTKFVTFRNRYGIDVAGHLYLPKNFNPNKKYAAIVVSGAFGAVKEQHSGLYAQEFAKAGFVSLAFDPSFTGESGGNVRNVASPDIFTEDFSAAIDFVGSLAYVDREKLGAMGICGLSGPAVTAAINDVRIKAVAVSAMYDMVDSIRNHYQGDYYTPEQREIVKKYLADMRWQEVEAGKTLPGYHEVPVVNGKAVNADGKLFPAELPANVDSVTKEFFDYYRGRAFHPRAINSNAIWSSTTPYGFFNFPFDTHVEELSPRPIMLITGDKAHSKYHSDNLYAQAKSPKEIVVVKGATHTDLYDQIDKIPFDKLNKFFKDNLK